MKVVLSGYYGYGNDGDEAILHAIISSLRKLDSNMEIVVLSGHPKSTEKLHHIKAISRWNIVAIMKEISSADGLISGGGSLLQDATSWRSIPYYLGIMMIAILLKKPFVIYAQGIGPISSRFYLWLTKTVLSQASLLTVRDSGSKALLEKIGVKLPIDVVPDPVIGLELDSLIGETQHVLSNPAVTVALRFWPQASDCLEIIANSLDLCQQKGFQVVFVPMQGTTDEEFSLKIAKLMKRNPIVLSGRLSMQEKVSIIGKSNVLVGMRLHSLIFAAMMGVPFVALSYDPKVEAFAKQFQQPSFKFLTNDWTENDLFTTILQQYEHAIDEKRKLNRFISVLKERVDATAEHTILVFRQNENGK